MLTWAGFELAPLGYQSTALLAELSSPQRLDVRFIQFKCTRYSRDNLTLIHERMCSVSILFQTHPQIHKWKFFMIIWSCRSQLKNVDLSGIWTPTFGIPVRPSTCWVHFGSVILSWKNFFSCISEDDSELESIITSGFAITYSWQTYGCLRRTYNVSQALTAKEFTSIVYFCRWKKAGRGWRRWRRCLRNYTKSRSSTRSLLGGSNEEIGWSRSFPTPCVPADWNWWGYWMVGYLKIQCLGQFRVLVLASRLTLWFIKAGQTKY